MVTVTSAKLWFLPHWVRCQRIERTNVSNSWQWCNPKRRDYLPRNQPGWILHLLRKEDSDPTVGFCDSLRRCDVSGKDRTTLVRGESHAEEMCVQRSEEKKRKSLMKCLWSTEFRRISVDHFLVLWNLTPTKGKYWENFGHSRADDFELEKSLGFESLDSSAF
ncbi:hypothetical protein NPIL_265931 [Nephila pilipes]|uniref:Uncharacterized protein n=1 Tax=Nephila pilipes TaxID=299642 RepID=A0A8X6NKD9_NEPPI|nr:hypothetical protein NPIL_265931 [Nephila pilipes]